jgi:hypothetical protein
MRNSSLRIPALVIILTALLGFDLYSGTSRPVVRGTVYDDSVMLPRLPATSPPSRSPGVLPLGIVLDSSYFDWQANGSLGRRIWTNGDGSVHVTYLKSVDEEFEDRGMHYYYSNELGENFVSHGNVGSFRNGYGSIASYPSTTPEIGAVAVISAHDYLTSTSSAFVDSAQGEGNFSVFAVDDSAEALWPKPSVNSDGSITLIGTYPGWINDVSYNVGRVVSPGHNQGFSDGWRWFGFDWDHWKSGDMQWPAVSSGENGRVGVVVPDLAADVHLFESTDAGRSFRGSIITTAVTDTLNLPQDIDTLATIFLPWQNADIVYAGEEPHIVWTALQGANDPRYGLLLYDYKSRILHWSPSTGIDTVVVSHYQGALPSEPETFIETSLNHTSIDWPQVGISPEGEVLYVVYVGFSPDDIDPLNNKSFGDIMGVYSTDNGNSWSLPQNITNPDGSYPGRDDRYPSISPVNHEATAQPGMDACVVYQSDGSAGSFVLGEESLNQDYLVFTGIDFNIPSDDIGGEKRASPPRTFSLLQNYPNPFNPHTRIPFDVPRGAGLVNLAIYDSRGRHVKTLLSRSLPAGEHQIVWDGRDQFGRHAGSGVFFYRLTVDGESLTKRMLLLK